MSPVKQRRHSAANFSCFVCASDWPVGEHRDIFGRNQLCLRVYTQAEQTAEGIFLKKGQPKIQISILEEMTANDLNFQLKLHSSLKIFFPLCKWINTNGLP